MGLIDSHAHLNDTRFDYKKIIADMEHDGLDKIITVGYDVSSSQFNVAIANENKNIYASAGIHPNDTLRAGEGDLKTIESLCAQNKVVALGEIGLDYHYPDTDKQKQQYFFVEQLKIAKRMNLPVIIHLRDAYADMRKLVSENLDCFALGAVMHCFSGSKEEAAFYIGKGFYISFSGAVTFSNARCDDVIKSVPLDRLMIETDCPYLTPNPHRGKLNYPAYVRYVCEKVAAVTGKTFDEIAKITSVNTVKLFNKITL